MGGVKMIYYVHYFAQIRIVLNNSKIKKKSGEISSVFLTPAVDAAAGVCFCSCAWVVERLPNGNRTGAKSRAVKRNPLKETSK